MLAGSHGSGKVDIAMGLVSMAFSQPVEAGSITYSTIILTAIPLDSDAIGIDPVRLPPDWQGADLSRRGGVVVVAPPPSISAPRLPTR